MAERTGVRGTGGKVKIEKLKNWKVEKLESWKVEEFRPSAFSPLPLVHHLTA
jgi:hypothetical protein